MPVANVQLLSLTFDVVHSVAMVHALFARTRRQARCRTGDAHNRPQSTVLSVARARHGPTVMPASNHLPADWHASAAIHAHFGGRGTSTRFAPRVRHDAVLTFDRSSRRHRRARVWSARRGDCRVHHDDAGTRDDGDDCLAPSGCGRGAAGRGDLRRRSRSPARRYRRVGLGARSRSGSF
jgi:hypothetical protein